MPDGVGLVGSIPAQLGNLSGLEDFYLDGNRLSGSIPPRLGRLVNLRWLHLAGNQLSGPIPTQLGDLVMLDNLRLEHNRLSGPLPTQLSNLSELSRIYVKGNSGVTGCVPAALRNVRTNDLANLSLPTCAADAPDTPETPLPAYTLTVTSGDGGAVDPPGASTHTEGVPVVVTASWNDATHRFAGWSEACSGSDTTCTVELYAAASVAAAFTALAADRCAAATDADCIRAVYQGAPDQDPISPTSYMQLIPPVGTTYTFTPTAHEGGANLLTFDLHAARPLPVQRPGVKPELGAIVATTDFIVPSLRYNRLNSRKLCIPAHAQ